MEEPALEFCVAILGVCETQVLGKRVTVRSNIDVAGAVRKAQNQDSKSRDRAVKLDSSTLKHCGRGPQYMKPPVLYDEG